MFFVLAVFNIEKKLRPKIFNVYLLVCLSVYKIVVSSMYMKSTLLLCSFRFRHSCFLLLLLLFSFFLFSLPTSTTSIHIKETRPSPIFIQNKHDKKNQQIYIETTIQYILYQRPMMVYNIYLKKKLFSELFLYFALTKLVLNSTVK